MGMLLRVHFVHPLCLIVEGCEAFTRAQRTFLLSHKGRGRAGPETCSPDSSSVSVSGNFVGKNVPQFDTTE